MHEQLNHVLNFIYEYDTSYGGYVNETELDVEISGKAIKHKDLQIILNKLIEDKLITSRDEDGQNEYIISFRGKVFVEQGGYKKEQNNRIIIIGNGFDLAHNLKTSYNDFADYIINKIIESPLDYIKTKIKLSNDSLGRYYLTNTFNDVPESIKILTSILNETEKDRVFLLKDFLIHEGASVAYRDYHDNSRIRAFSFKGLKFLNAFLEKLLSKSYKNWFAIEEAYFQEVLDIYNGKSDFKIEDLNRDFVQIKNWLKEYLEIQIESFEISSNVNQFFKKMLNKEIDSLYVIDFNYTGIFDFYQKELDKIKNYPIGVMYVDEDINEVKYVVHNQIHGTLGNNNMIFGYGDDRNENYKKLKESGVKEYLKFFKTFEYMKSDNYQNIFKNAIEVFDDYEVHVLGHSLDRCDRTLLEEIFDNDRCKWIHLYKRLDKQFKKDKKGDDLIDENGSKIENTEELRDLFIQQTYALARIFPQESRVRKITTSFESAKFFPSK